MARVVSLCMQRYLINGKEPQPCKKVMAPNNKNKWNGFYSLVRLLLYLLFISSASFAFFSSLPTTHIRTAKPGASCSKNCTVSRAILFSWRCNSQHKRLIRLGFCSPGGCAFPAPAPRAILHDNWYACQGRLFFIPAFRSQEQAPDAQPEIKKPGKRPAYQLSCDPVGIRTQDPQLRRLLLYPTELPDRPLHCPERQSGYKDSTFYFIDK